MNDSEKILSRIYDQTDELWYEAFAAIARRHSVADAEDQIAILATEVNAAHWRPSDRDIEAYSARCADEMYETPGLPAHG